MRDLESVTKRLKRLLKSDRKTENCSNSLGFDAAAGSPDSTKQEIGARRKAFIFKWRLKCRSVTDSLKEAGDKLFTFTRFPPSRWKSIRTSNATERLHEEFKNA